MIDFAGMSSEELEQLIDGATAEVRKRRVLESAQRKAEELSREVLAAEGVNEGDPWRQPTGAHDAYPMGWVVEHGGQMWESLVAGNVWEPGVSGWRAQPGEGEDPDTPAEWVKPTGGHDAYSTGDRVTFNGQVYESAMDGNVWSPADYPVGWILIEEE